VGSDFKPAVLLADGFGSLDFAADRTSPGAIVAPIRHSQKRNRRRRPAGGASGSLCCMSARRTAPPRQGIKTSPKCQRESTAETEITKALEIAVHIVAANDNNDDVAPIDDGDDDIPF